MGLRSGLARLARTGEVPVFVITGGGYRSAVHRLQIVPGIRIVASPRHAAVLLVAGNLSQAATETVSHIHDQMAGPRVTIGWGHDDPGIIPLRENVTGDVSAVATVIRDRFSDVVTGNEQGEPPILPNVDAVEWRGVGPYGHGGAGMTGGTPYGRPLALRAKDRDGLELDQLPVTVGPWFNGFPPGLAMRIALQGDVAQTVEVVTTDLVTGGRDGPFTLALHEPTAIHDLEMARARHHLEWMSDSLAVAGVDRLALRASRLAAEIAPGEGRRVEQLMTAARRSFLKRMTLGGVGVLPSDIDLAGLGPVTRAGGVSDDLRSSQQAYTELGFEPVTHNGGDAWARFSQRAAEAAQAVDLAGDAGDRVAFGGGEVEAPDGPRRIDGSRPADRLLSMLGAVLEGMEWGDLVTIVQSLDIDMESVSVGNEAL